ncbi:MAG: PadR family transcriptional regulator [Candidatus Dormibacteria bacterium]
MTQFGREHDHDRRGGHRGMRDPRVRHRFGAFGDNFPLAFGRGFGGRARGFRGARTPRGNVRAAALLLLAERPRNGYQLMQEIAQRSKGVWQPSPGSIYPALQQLEDEGLVRAEDVDGQRLLTLSDAGMTYTEEHRTEFGTPWEEASGAVGDDIHELLSLMRQASVALLQVAHAGSPGQVANAAQLMKETRQNLYRILAEEDVGTGVDSKTAEH